MKENICKDNNTIPRKKNDNPCADDENKIE